jgi:hypothetical protein
VTFIVVKEGFEKRKKKSGLLRNRQGENRRLMKNRKEKWWKGRILQVLLLILRVQLRLSSTSF